jgi:hypothetical protein
LDSRWSPFDGSIGQILEVWVDQFFAKKESTPRRLGVEKRCLGRGLSLHFAELLRVVLAAKFRQFQAAQICCRSEPSSWNQPVKLGRSIEGTVSSQVLDQINSQFMTLTGEVSEELLTIPYRASVPIY